jgi:hypothetical protein
MTAVPETLESATRCPHGGVPVGFAAIFRPGPEPAEMRTRLSCGCRHTGTGQPLRISAFRSAPPVTVTSVSPAERQIRRGPLSQTPVFYTCSPDGVARVATDLSGLVDADTPALAAAVAAQLVGHPLPSPLTPWEGVFRLPAGATLTYVPGDRIRVQFDGYDWRELYAAHPGGRGDESTQLRAALADAIADTAAGALAFSGGAASAALAAVAAESRAGLPLRHVHVAVPVLDSRRDRLTAYGPTGGALPVEVVDGTEAWTRRRDADVPPLPEQCDPWPVRAADGLPGGGRVASAYGLAGLFPDPPEPPPTGWRLLTVEQVPTAHWGKSWAEVRRGAQPAATDAGGSPAGGSPTGGGTGIPSWLGDAARSGLRTAQAGALGSHLLPREGEETRVMAMLANLLAVLDGCGLSRVDPPGADGCAPALIATHPAVVAAALRRVDGPVRRGPGGVAALVPPGWADADPPPGGRDRLYAAAYVRHRLASEPVRADLLERVRGGGWVDDPTLATMLGSAGSRLRNSALLHRLHSTALAYPALMAEGRS